MYQECKGLANAYIYSDCSSGQGVWYSLQLSLRLDQFMRIKNIPFFVDQPCQKWVFVMHYYLSWVSMVHSHPGEEVIIFDCIFCSNSSQWKYSTYATNSTFTHERFFGHNHCTDIWNIGYEFGSSLSNKESNKKVNFF